jgi:hypothetical protein
MELQLRSPIRLHGVVLRFKKAQGQLHFNYTLFFFFFFFFFFFSSYGLGLLAVPIQNLF